MPAAKKRSGRKIDNKASTKVSAKDLSQKRRAQNRAAQQAFRERKEKFVSDLQQRIQALEKEKANEDKDIVRENKRLKEQLKQLLKENYALKETSLTFGSPNVQTKSPTQTPSQESDTKSVASSQDKTVIHGNESMCSDTSTVSLSLGSNSNSNINKESFSFDQDNPAEIPADHDFDFLVVPDAINAFDFGLLTGKERLFSDYRIPLMDNLLFNTDVDLFGLDAPASLVFGESSTLSVSSGPPSSSLTFSATDIQELSTEEQKGLHRYDEEQVFASHFPDLNLDLFCDDFINKAQCSDYTTSTTGHDVDNPLKRFGA